MAQSHPKAVERIAHGHVDNHLAGRISWQELRRNLRALRERFPDLYPEDLPEARSADVAAAFVYPGIDFGSDRAFEIARDHQLSTEELAGIEGTGTPDADGDPAPLLADDVRDYVDAIESDDA